MQIAVRGRREAENGLRMLDLRYRGSTGFAITEPAEHDASFLPHPRPICEAGRRRPAQRRTRGWRRSPKRPACRRCAAARAAIAGLCAIVCGQQLSTAQRRGDPRPAVRGVRSLPPRRRAAGARRQAHAARPVQRQDQVDQGNRQGGCRGPHRSRRGRQHGCRRGARRADRAARHRARGPPTSICCSASAMPTPFRPATSPCRRRRASRSICASGRTPRR